MRRFINDLDIAGLRIISVLLAIDNQAALSLARNPNQHERAIHIDEIVESVLVCPTSNPNHTMIGH